MDRCWGNFGTIVSANITGLVGSGERVRHCDTVDLRCLQVEGWRASVLPRWSVPTRIDYSRGRFAFDDKAFCLLDRHSMDPETRNNETDDKVLLYSDHWGTVKPIRD